MVLLKSTIGFSIERMTKTQHKYTEKKLRLKKGPMFSALYNGINIMVLRR
jgi:hypothetical protein